MILPQIFVAQIAIDDLDANKRWGGGIGARDRDVRRLDFSTDSFERHRQVVCRRQLLLRRRLRLKQEGPEREQKQRLNLHGCLVGRRGGETGLPWAERLSPGDLSGHVIIRG